ncbi:endoglucanase [Lactobacillus sp. CBA3605]|uniref:GDSL-type esterase/lipase family protein n=1 Tax=Lactobacillus sp. CBA3605 TaxID=2099788 RepID=UPI000CFAAFF4|nr:GDSL-type esterase/lipase family protein [Lactobacillus sp. CBA3605]AVK61406.1 endoglucanase [Lactobacillus sp. CBA3605]
MRVQVTIPNNPVMTAYFQGRWAVKTIQNQTVMYSTNLGSEVWFKVTQAQLVTIKMLPLAVAEASWMALQIDGLPYQRIAISTLPYRLTLDGRSHVIRLVMSGNTDADPVWQGDSGFAVVGLESDGQLQAVKPGQHGITFIGDSITAGCWVAGNRPAVDYRAEANYAVLASDVLNARNVRIAYSAAGLKRPGTGGVPPLPQVLTAINATTSWQPEPTAVVVINVGTNDRRSSAAEFTLSYRQFLQQVQQLYPMSQIAVLVPFNQAFDRIIRTVVATFPAIKLIETADWAPTTTDYVHLDRAGSRVAGQYLAQALQQLYPMLFGV